MNALLQASQEKKRKFTETVELQVALKNYDPQKDKRFSGTVKYAKQDCSCDTWTWTLTQGLKTNGEVLGVLLTPMTTTGCIAADVQYAVVVSKIYMLKCYHLQLINSTYCETVNIFTVAQLGMLYAMVNFVACHSDNTDTSHICSLPRDACA